jgi:hypothetical protein
MVQTVALLGDLADDRTDIAPRLRKLGAQWTAMREGMD